MRFRSLWVKRSPAIFSAEAMSSVWILFPLKWRRAKAPPMPSAAAAPNTRSNPSPDDPLHFETCLIPSLHFSLTSTSLLTYFSGAWRAKKAEGKRKMAEETKDTVYKLRWFVLGIMGLVIFGVYYAYYVLSPIADFIMKGINISRAQYGLLFSFYYVPNFIIVLIGGILLDRIGIRKAGTLFAALCAAGVVLTAATKIFPVMLMGRLLYGLGAETPNTPQQQGH